MFFRVFAKKKRKRNVMNLQTDFTKLNSSIQETFKNWDNKILQNLPKQWIKLQNALALCSENAAYTPAWIC